MARFRKRNFRTGKPLPFRYVLLLSIVFFILSSTIGLAIVNIAIKPPLTAYAESQSVNLATYVINKAIEEEVGNGLSLDEMIKIIPVEGNTVTVFDTDKILRVSKDITNNILKNINAVEEGHVYSTTIITDGDINEVHAKHGEGIHFKVPFGRITDNVLLGSLGPDIPVKFHAIGDVEYDIKTVREHHDINSTWYEIRLHMKVGIQIVVPFLTELKVVEQNILLAAGEIKGKVPQFYSSNGGLAPSIQIQPEDVEEKDGG
ncbi:sporulation protein YunB [Bacillus kwashiorkori]|uniref:sporulation protein YunB n=1 Tax=Bacillus kwashiorkori TaxID=1522318 RepID=UPI000780F4C6|nr:sporulation protein YunB [Bacillus kwashiorkori]